MDKTTDVKLEATHSEWPSKVDAIETDEATISRVIRRKIDYRMLPLFAFLYLLNYLDRSNIGNGKNLNEETGDSLMQQTGMDAKHFSIALTVFAISYSIFDVPSNWIMKHYVRPDYWLAFLMFAWGVLTLGFAFVQNFPSIVAIRFLVGMFEAGFFPGIVYLISFWYRKEERSVRIAFVLASASLAGAFGGCIGYGVGFMNGTAGLEGFRWLFLIESIITIVCVILVIRILPTWPSEAKWLSEEEKQLATDRVNEQGSGFDQEHASRRERLETFIGPRMLAHYLAYFTVQIPLSSLAYFTPSIVQGLGYSSVHAQLMTVPPWAVGYVFCLIIGWSADRYNARGWHIVAATICSGVGFLVAGLLPPDAYAQRYGCLIVIAIGAFPSAAPLTAWVTCNAPSARTIGLAAGMNNAAVGLAGIAAVWLWDSKEASAGYPTGNFTCAACSFVTTILVVGLRLNYARMNKQGAPDTTGAARVWVY